MLLVLLFVSVVRSFDYGNLFGFVDLHSRCLSGLLSITCECPIYSDYVERVSNALRTRLFGQPDARDKLRSIIINHDFFFGKKATVVHIAGDNGVGKTFSTSLLAANIFSSRDSYGLQKGYLYLRGSFFCGDSEESIKEHQDSLREKVVRQLYACPHSLVVFDEVELVNPNTILAIQSFLDSTVPVVENKGWKADITKAIFVFISDFGVEGMSEGKSQQQLKEIVHIHSLKFWKDIKQNSLIEHVIPFSPLNQEGVREMVEYFLEHGLKKHNVFKKALVGVSVNIRFFCPSFCYYILVLLPFSSSFFYSSFFNPSPLPLPLSFSSPSHGHFFPSCIFCYPVCDGRCFKAQLQKKKSRISSTRNQLNRPSTNRKIIEELKSCWTLPLPFLLSRGSWKFPRVIRVSLSFMWSSSLSLMMLM
eukprot:TRINITY_DN8731_c0_g1_i6.p1 TRINITY_DN8731_c0_g1~~TRINITY_DN8731_c0_g1_i6.p1  ORF type:complete len:419 (-),score=60.55 TRINITY_DN8731_c0_g1_i6:884-2140(-)